MSYISSNAPSSPSKFCRVNGSAATLARTKDDVRAELRTMAHKKVYVSDVNSFFNNFFPPNPSTSKKAIPNIFKGAPTTFTSEKAMYKWLVRSPPLSLLCLLSDIGFHSSANA